jgi:hypothetical protein
MKVELILPALTEATSPLFRPIKYSLFPPLGLATLASYLDPADQTEIQDAHVDRALSEMPRPVVGGVARDTARPAARDSRLARAPRRRAPG